MKARAAVLMGPDRPFELVDLDWDEPRPDEVGVRVVACGVCHSDWHCVNGDYPVQFPLLAGHEAAGVVERVGSSVDRVSVGDHVVLAWMPACGRCAWCVAGRGHLCDRGARLLGGEREDGSNRARLLDGTEVRQLSFVGGFSEYIVVPQDGCIPVADDLDLASIAVIGCRIPTGWGAATVTAAVEQAATALVVGVGGVGANILQGLRSAGATVVIAADVVDKGGWAEQFGATHFVHAGQRDVLAAVREITGIGVDYAFDAVGDTEVQALCAAAIHKGGRAVWVGAAPAHQQQVRLDAQQITLHQKTLGGTCYGGASPFTLVPRLLDLYRAGKVMIDELVTATYDLDRIDDAFADMLAGRNLCGVIRFG